MKLNFYDTMRIVFLSVLFSSNILCSEMENKEKINISEGFMKHKKSNARSSSSASNKSAYSNTNLLQTKERTSMNTGNKATTSSQSSANSAAHTFSKSAAQTSAQTAAHTFAQTSAKSRQVQSFNQNSNLMTQTNLGETVNKLANENDGDGPNMDLNIGGGPIYVTGWISFFKYIENTETRKLKVQNTPTTFIPNGQYEEQFKLYPNFDKEEKSNDGTNVLPKYIPDKRSFYAILLKDSFNILTSRQVNFLNLFKFYSFSKL